MHGNIDTGRRERGRLEALDRYDILDTPREETFDRITRIARNALQVPIAIVSAIDGHRQWYKSIEGLQASEVPREQSFCKHVIAEGTPLIVPNAAEHPLFASHPMVTGDPGIRFYAGVPLTTHDGHHIGTLCVIDMRPRELGPGFLAILNDLARVVIDELELRMLATTDSLTGAMSRRAFKEQGARAAALALRHHQDLSAIAFDLDHFKAINDRYGHAAGDEVLARTVRAVTEELRDSDLVGRLGGEEFAVLLPQTARDGAMLTAERLRSTVESLVLTAGSDRLRVTASFGVASFNRTTRDLETLLGQADAALYRAKAAGRNQVVVSGGTETAADASRRRVLKGGKVLFNARTSVIDCTVRSISQEGAGLDVSSTVGVPKQFELAIPADNFEKNCRVLTKTDRHIEVEFI
jgi:diguanylate cyclase (GGDEF)-like protein